MLNGQTSGDEGGFAGQDVTRSGQPPLSFWTDYLANLPRLALPIDSAGQLDDGYAYKKDLGWTEFARDGLQLIEVASEHYEMLKPPYVQFVANKLAEAIQSALASHFCD